MFKSNGAARTLEHPPHYRNFNQPVHQPPKSEIVINSLIAFAADLSHLTHLSEPTFPVNDRGNVSIQSRRCNRIKQRRSALDTLRKKVVWLRPFNDTIEG
ncbi:hypothetical protein NPIL_194261 [Nephila pilipes]|uniref:Uncharacterized protein n=1 Tax=Nephila pilipes TaxID=299642 RepID=A0A8X6TBJ0_NEPPI|nr:hypothetical protein NPIL_194261 [Nephila pilipes]